jgi:hypothetical protein
MTEPWLAVKRGAWASTAALASLPLACHDAWHGVSS